MKHLIQKHIKYKTSYFYLCKFLHLKTIKFIIKRKTSPPQSKSFKNIPIETLFLFSRFYKLSIIFHHFIYFVMKNLNLSTLISFILVIHYY